MPALQVCLGCGCRYSAGAPCCPQCRGTDWRPDYEEGDVAKIAKQGGVSHGPGAQDEPSTSGALDTAHEYADEVPGPDTEPAAEPPDLTPDPGPGQVSTPEPSSPASSEPSGEPEVPAMPEDSSPEVVTGPEPAPAPAPKPKPAPSLSRAKDAPAEITGSGGVVLPKPEASLGD